LAVGAEAPSLLAGLIVDANGSRMTPTHATKKAKRYHYYVSASLPAGDHPQAQKGMRVPAGDIEALVLDRLMTQSAANRSPPSNFPVIREKTGNFEIIANLEQKTGANFEANSECYRQIPCATEQGIAFARTGNFEQQNRECIRAIRESA
jgi:hypothetical protein